LPLRSPRSGGGGNRNLTDEYRQVPSGHISPENSDDSVEPTPAEYRQPKDDCSNVVNAPRSERQNEVAERLAAARAEWLGNPNEKTLRAALLDVLQRLEESE
jgi:hypothetical protein